MKKLSTLYQNLKNKYHNLNKEDLTYDSTSISPIKTKNQIWSHPHLCECEHLAEDHNDNLCPLPFRIKKAGNIITLHTIKLQSYTEILTDPIAYL